MIMKQRKINFFSLPIIIRATKITQRYSQLKTSFHLQMLSKLSPTRDLNNGRSLENNPYLRDLDQLIEWCQHRLVSLDFFANHQLWNLLQNFFTIPVKSPSSNLGFRSANNHRRAWITPSWTPNYWSVSFKGSSSWTSEIQLIRRWISFVSTVVKSTQESLRWAFELVNKAFVWSACPSRFHHSCHWWAGLVVGSWKHRAQSRLVRYVDGLIDIKPQLQADGEWVQWERSAN